MYPIVRAVVTKADKSTAACFLRDTGGKWNCLGLGCHVLLSGESLKWIGMGATKAMEINDGRGGAHGARFILLSEVKYSFAAPDRSDSGRKGKASSKERYYSPKVWQGLYNINIIYPQLHTMHILTSPREQRPHGETTSKYIHIYKYPACSTSRIFTCQYSPPHRHRQTSLPPTTFRSNPHT